jgi:hypothetical protein
MPGTPERRPRAQEPALRSLIPLYSDPERQADFTFPKAEEINMDCSKRKISEMFIFFLKYIVFIRNIYMQVAEKEVYIGELEMTLIFNPDSDGLSKVFRDYQEEALRHRVQEIPRRDRDLQPHERLPHRDKRGHKDSQSLSLTSEALFRPLSNNFL